MPQTKHMRELGCLSMVAPPCAASLIASTWGLGKRAQSETGANRRSNICRVLRRQVGRGSLSAAFVKLMNSWYTNCKNRLSGV